MKNGTADPVDVFVGGRIRLARRLLGMSQDALASHLGITFQQVQKYERGANRISASMLWRAAHATGHTPAYFFEGLEGPTGSADLVALEQRAMETVLRFPPFLRLQELTTDQQRALATLIDSFLPEMLRAAAL